MIEQHLVGSVTNITPTTMSKIEEGKLNIPALSSPYRCFIPVLEDPLLEQKLVKETDIILLTTLARENGCTWVHLDKDIDPIEILPDYSDLWEETAPDAFGTR
jgi:hypothetical protein